eukprot:12820981-Heterocapsa_arctica.AAC.1
MAARTFGTPRPSGLAAGTLEMAVRTFGTPRTSGLAAGSSADPWKHTEVPSRIADSVPPPTSLKIMKP